MKQIAVIISGASGDNVKDVTLPPGATAGDVLQAIGLGEDFLLSREGSSQVFSREEDVYDAVPEGGKLRATPLAVVGAGSRESLMTQR